ncbi:MAG: TonB-dependent receptor [Chitinophagaceae bacterium]
MKPKQLCVLLFVLMLMNSALAQNKQVKGTVIDAATNTPLSGVSITVPGTSTGTTTDNSGRFSLSIPSNARDLLFSMVNYQNVTVNASGTLNIRLSSEARGMDEVVVVGYGTQKKKDLTGAISTIGAKDVGGRQTIQVSDALQGSIAGVSVTRSNGAPGSGSNILIRGITTIGTNSPLIIIDGVPVSNIDNVNPNDVESISVLKDAASAAIYGSRGAAGVVLITTKRAKDGQTSFEYNYEYGAQKPTALPKYVGVQDYMRYFNEQLSNDGGAALYAKPLIDNYADSNRLNPDKFPNTDWQNTILQNNYAPRSRHDLVFTMGTGKLKSKASLGYSNAGAFYDNYKYERYQFRVNTDLQINSRLSANLDVAYKRTNNKATNGSPINESRVMPPIYDDYYSDGRYAAGKDGRNPIAQIYDGGYTRNLYNQIAGRLALNFKPINGLTLTALVSPTFDMDKSKTFSKQIKYTAAEDPSRVIAQNQARTSLGEGRAESTYIIGQFLANYNKQIGKDHTIDVLAGYEENYSFNDSLRASRDGFALTNYPYLNAGSLEFRDNSGTATESSLRSVFGRLKYDFRNKYYLQGNLRYDKSSRFAPQFRDALFPSLSAGWNISEEHFLQNIKWLSFLKVRGSWGEAGNERIGNYPYQAIISFSNALFYQNGIVVPQTGGGQVVYAVENISWETTQTSDVGIDAAFLQNRLTITGDYFKKRTSDILLQLDIPNYLGYDNPYQNAGTLDATGWELEAGWKDRIGKLNYSIAVNLSDTKTKIVDLKGTQFRADQAILQGGEFNEWFGYRSNGLFQTDADRAGAPVLNANTKAGDVRYIDLNKDGKITPEGDKELLGGSLPRYLYGGNIRVDYKGFDVGVIFQGVGKKRSRLGNDLVQPFAEAFGNVSMEIANNFWSKNNTAEKNLAAKYPRLSRTSNTNNYEMSDFYLINGAYFRLKNFTVGYTLNQEVIKKAGVQSLRLYLAANDFFSISKFPKYTDPEVGNASYPIVTTIMAGATIKF